MPVESKLLPCADDAPPFRCSLEQVFDEQRRAFAANPMPTLQERRQWLDRLHTLLSTERQAIIDAINGKDSWEKPDGGACDPVPLKRHPC